MVPAFILVFFLGITLGSYVAWKRGAFIEKAVVTGSMVLRSAPDFWVGIVFILIFCGPSLPIHSIIVSHKIYDDSKIR